MLEVLHIQKKYFFEVNIFHGGHFGFSGFHGVAQSCTLGNQAKFVLEPYRNTNLQKNFIVLEISRLIKFQLD